MAHSSAYAQKLLVISTGLESLSDQFKQLSRETTDIATEANRAATEPSGAHAADTRKQSAEYLGNVRRYMSRKQAAEYLGVAVGTVDLWRYEHRGPAWAHCGPRRITYAREDLDAWIEAQRVESFPLSGGAK